MQLVLLAAGKGSRLNLPITNKCFAKVYDKYLLDYNLEMFLACKLSEIIIITGYNAEYIKKYIGNTYHGISVIYVMQEQLLGIAHALKVASDYIHEDFIMCLSDELFINPTVNEMYCYFKDSQCDCLCGAVTDTVENIQKAYTMDLNIDGTILQLIEKPQSVFNEWKGTGCCFMKQTMLAVLKKLLPNAKRNEYEMGDWIQLAVSYGLKCKMYPIADANFNINTTDEILLAESYFANLKEENHE